MMATMQRNHVAVLVQAECFMPLDGNASGYIVIINLPPATSSSYLSDRGKPLIQGSGPFRTVSGPFPMVSGPFIQGSAPFPDRLLREADRFRTCWS